MQVIATGNKPAFPFLRCSTRLQNSVEGMHSRMPGKHRNPARPQPRNRTAASVWIAGFGAVAKSAAAAPNQRRAR